MIPCVGLHSPENSITVVTPLKKMENTPEPRFERNNISSCSDFTNVKNFPFLPSVIPNSDRAIIQLPREIILGAADVTEEIETPIRRPNHMKPNVRRRSLLNQNLVQGIKVKKITSDEPFGLNKLSNSVQPYLN